MANEIVMTVLGLTIAAVILAGATLPLALAPTVSDKFNVTNSTAISYVVNATALPSNYSYFTLSGVDTNYPALGTITWSRFGTNYINITTKTGTVLATATASPATFNLTGAQLASGLTINYSSNSSHVQHAPNITSVQIEYRMIPKSEQQGWDSAVTTIYKILVPLALIAAFIIFFMG